MSKMRLATQFQAFALLIDADNISVDLFPHIMQKVEGWGTMTIRRIYGNQETLLSQKWKEACLRYALQPMPHVGISGAKNATDIALTVDAMDTLWLHKESVMSFCLVTGDQDFTALVLRLRSQGCKVYCIGRPTKADALAKVCTEFFSLEHLSAPVAPPVQKALPAETPPVPNGSGELHLDPALTQLLIKATEKIMQEKQVEWVPLSLLGACLKQLDATFEAKAYGQSNLPKLMKLRTDLFDFRPQGVHLEVRLKARG